MSHTIRAARSKKGRSQSAAELVVEPGLAAGIFSADEALSQALKPKRKRRIEPGPNDHIYDELIADLNARTAEMEAELAPVIAKAKAYKEAKRQARAEAKAKKVPAAKQTRTVALDRPTPPPGFPLFPDASGRWRKRVRGRAHYFGKWADDPKGKRAAKLWREQRDDLLAGRTPRGKQPLGLELHTLVNEFLLEQERKRDSGEIRKTTFGEYVSVGKMLATAFGRDRLVDDLAADDFRALRMRLDKRYGPHAISRKIQCVRTLFKHGYDSGLMDKPIRFGPSFKKPPARIMRAHRQKSGPKMFEAAELLMILDAAEPQMKAMILLAANCGFGNHDCGLLPLSAIDFKRGWVDFPRPKTAVERRCPLWDETIGAIKVAREVRPRPKLKEHAGLVFITKYGGPWATDSPTSPISHEFRKLLQRIDRQRAAEAKKQRTTVPEKLYRPGRGFYALRHTFETIAGGSRDQVAVNHAMGHVDATMAGTYRERIEDERLERVANHVHAWLWPRVTEDAQ